MKVEQRKGDWLQTFTGRQFWPLDPRPEEIFIEDIARALSMQCRFAGHVRQFYSVAQHSLAVSLLVPEAHALWGLLHDAAEAYLVDLPRPIKRHSILGDEYRAIEATIMAAVCRRFGMRELEPYAVQKADLMLLMTERRDVLAPSIYAWSIEAEPLPDRLIPMSPDVAEALFLRRFQQLRYEGETVEETGG